MSGYDSIIKKLRAQKKSPVVRKEFEEALGEEVLSTEPIEGTMDREEKKVLEYLNIALEVYKKEKSIGDAIGFKERKECDDYLKDNPGFRNYREAALLLYREELDQIKVEENLDQSLNAAFDLAITALQSKKIFKSINNDQKAQIIANFKILAQNAIKDNTPFDKIDWHVDFKPFLLKTKDKKEIDKSNSEINKTIAKSLESREPYASYDTEELVYDFYQEVEYACRQYEDLYPNPPPHRQENLSKIRQMLTTFKNLNIMKYLNALKENDERKDILNILGCENLTEISDNSDFFKAKWAMKAILGYLDSDDFKSGFSSRLKNLVKNALQDLDKKSERVKKKGDMETFDSRRTIKTKIWSDPKKDPPSRQLVLAIHGLQDSVDTFNVIANQYVEAGYTVKSYDQAGAGFDELRVKGGKLDLKQMQFDFYRMLEEAYNDPNYDEIILVGHSLGGAIISNSLNTIQKLNENPTEVITDAEDEKFREVKTGKIQKIQLIAPAVMENPKLQMIGSLPTILSNPGDKSEHAKYIRGQRITREGGAGITPSVLFTFIKFVANGFKNLKHFFQKKEFTIPIEVHYAKDDKLVQSKNFKKLKSLANPKRVKGESSKVEPSETSEGIGFFKSKGGHHLHSIPVEGIASQSKKEVAEEKEWDISPP